MIYLSADINNPIIVISQLANEKQYGLCPVLRTNIRDHLEAPDMSASVVCEEALSLELAQIPIPYVSGWNYVSLAENSANVFEYSQPHNDFFFKAVQLSGMLYVNKTQEDIYEICTPLTGEPADRIEITTETTNGGSLKESFMVKWEDFYNNSNEVSFNLPSNHIIIGKIFVEVIEPFSYPLDPEIMCSSAGCIIDDYTAKYTSFKIKTDSEDFVETFFCPSSSGEIKGIPYAAKAFYPNGEQLKIVKTSNTIDTDGLFKITIHYDNTNYMNENDRSLICFGGRKDSSISNEIEILDLYTITESFIRHNLTTQRAGGAALKGKNDKEYAIIGGATSLDSNQYTLTDRRQIFYAISGSISANNASQSNGNRLNAAAADGNTYGYMIGGFTTFKESTTMSFIISNTISKYERISASLSSISSTHRVAGAAGCADFPNMEYCWIFGGRTEATASTVEESHFTNGISRMDFATETVESNVAYMLNSCDGVAVIQDMTKFWIMGGNDKYSSSVRTHGAPLSEVQTFDPNTSVIALKHGAPLSQPRGYMAAKTNIERSAAFIAGGGNISTNVDQQYKWIDKLELDTDTICIRYRSRLTDDKSNICGI
ncbi:MAG TPA: hypothetical protein PLA71_00585 [Saccharofermentans sp.]|nr:hypothetical protein [Saccharofermentans sp.]